MNNLTRVESDWMLRLGLYFLIRSISYTRQNELVDSTILSFIKSKLANVSSLPPVVPVEQPVRILLPFKGQKSADVWRKQLNNLSNRIGTPLQPIYTSRKLGDVLGVKKTKALSDWSTQCGLPIFMSSVRCRIHRPHNSTPFSKN